MAFKAKSLMIDISKLGAGKKFCKRTCVGTPENTITVCEMGTGIMCGSEKREKEMLAEVKAHLRALLKKAEQQERQLVATAKKKAKKK